MARNFEDCPVCGERKSVLYACPRCGFRQSHRDGRDRPPGNTQMKIAMQQALNAARDNEPNSRSRTDVDSAKATTSRNETSRVRSKATQGRAHSPEVDTPRWSALEDESTVRVRPTSESGADTVREKPPTGGQESPSRDTMRTQASPGADGAERDIIIGLDFGTACTKAIIGDDVLQTAYAVPFGELAYDGHPYLIATRVYAAGDGSLSLETGQISVDDLKIKLLGDPHRPLLAVKESKLQATTLDCCVGYLALVLREVVAWFLETHADAYRNANLAWQLNIGLPSRSYDNKELKETYFLLALAAWRAAVRAGPITVTSARDALEKSSDDIHDHESGVDVVTDENHMHPADIGVVPEVIAEVVGYARSNLRREGTHLLVDVGASTVDVATFVLHSKDDEDNYELLTTEVEQQGALVLHRQRVTDVAAYVEQRLVEMLGAADGISPIPDLESYQPIDQEGLREVDAAFLARCDRLISMVVHETRTSRNPIAYVWEEGLPVFLCGGGSRIQLYRDAVAAAERNVMRKAGFDLLDLPVPENLEGDELGQAEYRRLAVAYGLSTRRDRIGNVVPPQAIKDIRPPTATRDWRDAYVGSEMT